MGTASRRPGAIEDIVEIGMYYALNGSPGSAERSLDSFDEALLLLARHPLAGRIWQSGNPRLKCLRCWPVKGFDSVLVFYREFEDGIEVIRVLHGARELESLLEDDIPADEEQR